MSLMVNVSQRTGLAVISLGGELDIATAPQVDEALTGVLSAGGRGLVFDLGELSFCDSTGLRLFVRAHQEFEAKGGRIALAGATDMVRQVLEVSGLARVFGAYHTVAEASAAIG